MANKYRGEVTLKLGPNKWTMTPTFEALAQIEEMTGRTCQHLVVATAMGSTTAREYAVICYCGIKAADPDADVTVNKIGQLIMDNGGTKAIDQTLTDFFEGLIRFYGPGDEPSEGDEEAAEFKKKT